jgi:hypothetical protein
MLSSFENWRPGKSRDFVPFQPGPMLKVMEARTGGWSLPLFFDVAVVVFIPFITIVLLLLNLAGVDEIWLSAVMWCESVG